MFLKKSLLAFCLVLSLSGYAVPSKVLKKNMMEDLNHIQQAFSVKYAPLLWKEQYKGWNLHKEIGIAKAKLKQLPEPTIPQFQKIVKEFCQSCADYHVGVSFYATAYSFLDFSIKGAEGAYFLVDIDRQYLPFTRFPFKEGDRLISFNGQPISEAIEDFKKKNFSGGNTETTDQALAECFFTQRFACRGHEVPVGEVQIEVRKKEGTVHKHTMNWISYEEKIGMPGARQEYVVTLPGMRAPIQSPAKKENFLTRMMVSPYWSEGGKRPGHKTPTHEIGARRSFLPSLGKIIWSTGQDDFFDAYIFESKGRAIGYIRIANYCADEEEAAEFAEIIKLLQANTDALVIDQLNNPGGSVFYLYALASMLTDKPLSVPKHHISLTQEDVYLATTFLEALEEARSLKEIHEVLGSNFGGYPVTIEFAQNLQEHARFLIREWNEGRFVTNPTYLLGVEKIQPAQISYTKPIILLINALDFSGGDFFPAILQDNQRALIVGERTAGAGGYVLRNYFYNRSSIQCFTLTGSLALRDGGNPLENLGVEPDVKLAVTAYDLQNDYKKYKGKILSLLDQILPEE